MGDEKFLVMWQDGSGRDVILEADSLEGLRDKIVEKTGPSNA